MDGTEQKHEGWVINDIILIFGWTNPLKINKHCNRCIAHSYCIIQYEYYIFLN